MPRMWKCVGYTQDYEKLFTVGKTYIEGDDGSIVNDQGYRYSSVDGESAPQWLREWYKFEEVEMNAKEYIKNGSFVKYRGEWFIALVGGVYARGVLSQISDEDDDNYHILKDVNDEEIEFVCNARSEYYGIAEMIRMVAKDADAEDLSEYFNVEYEKKEVKEMTVGEIEAILGYKIKVVKED